MAKKLSELTAATTFTPATDIGIGVVSGATRKITFDNEGLFERGHPVASGGTRVGIPGTVLANQNTLAAVADTIYYSPILVTDVLTVDACLCEVTAAAGTVARLGILAANTAWQPTAVTQDAGTVDPSGSGVKTASFTAITLQPGRYLTALVCDGAATFRVANAMVPFGEVNPSLSASLTLTRKTKASVGTGALSASNVWDTNTAAAASNSHQYPVFLRLTGV